MALTAYGFGQSYPPAIGAKFYEAASGSYKGMRVAEGFNVTAGPGAALTVSRGVAVMPGLYVEDNAAASVPITSAHRGKSNLLVIDADWTANSNAGSIGLSLVQGGSTFPAPTQQAGTRWQMPLARVVVSSAGAITRLETCKPIERRPYDFSGGTVDSQLSSLVRTIQDKPMLDVDIPDPGWPYRLKGEARIHASAPNGRIYLEMFDVVGSTWRRMGHDISGNMASTGESVPPHDVFGRTQSPITGESRVVVRLSGSGITTGQIGIASQTYTHLYVWQYPA